MSRSTTSPSMGRPRVVLVGVCLVALALAACGVDGEPRIELGPAVAGQPRGGVTQVVLEVVNAGDGADRLVAVGTNAAVSAEIHRTAEDAAAGMQPVGGVGVGPGDRVVFEPDGLHLMLIAPRASVAPGATFELVLEFERTGTRTVEVEVVEQVDLRR